MNPALRLAFIGDDFTGSTDALEALTLAGLRCALLLKPSRPEVLRQFGPLDAIGIASDCRSMTPQEMDERLPVLFDAMAALDPRIVHYKVCSTFDSSPQIGSIGHVMRVARASSRFAAGPFAVLGGNPALGRYCAFRNLFAHAATDGRVHRIDRHPIMSLHPVTPMDEADLGIHLRKQSEMSIASCELSDIERPAPEFDHVVDRLWDAMADAVLFDATTVSHMTAIGRQLGRISTRDSRPAFVVGSSGVEYALTQAWREHSGEPPRRLDSWFGVDRVLAISGSASRMSGTQIARAAAAGFEVVAVSARRLVDDAECAREAAGLRDRAVTALSAGRSVLLHSATGPGDSRIAEMLEFLREKGLDAAAVRHEGGRLLGVRLGLLAREILERIRVRRLLLAGGDTSSHVMQVLGADALTVIARISPGVPLCRLSCPDPTIDGLEVALKGGQLGGEDFFEAARAGCAPPAWE